MRKGLMAWVLVALLAVPASGTAQVPWDSPLLTGAGSPSGLSVWVVDPGWGLGAVGQWLGRPSGNPRLGVRVGLADGPRDDLAAFGGVDFSGLLVSHNRDFPLDMVWVGGLGLGAGHDAILTVPFGLSLGRTLRSEDTWLNLYFTPRFVLDAFLGENTRDDLDLGMAVDLGFDLGFGEGWALRFGASVGDREGVAVGLAVPGRG